MKTLFALFIALAVALAYYAATEDHRAIGLAELAPSRPSKAVPEKGVLRVLSFQGCVPRSVYDRLRTEEGIRVEETTYVTNDDFVRLMASGKPFDLALAPDFIALRYERIGASRLIDYRRIPNQVHLAAGLRNNEGLAPLFRCSVPYLFGTFGLGYSSEHLALPPLSWNALFKPVSPELMRGRLGLLDDARQTLGMALIALGKSPNSRDPADLAAAAGLVEHCMDDLAILSPDMLKRGSQHLARELASGDLYLVMARACDVAAAMDRNPGVRFANQDEGTLLYFFCFVVLRTARSVPLADEFIDYMLRPEISAEVTNFSYLATLNEEASPYVRRDLLGGPTYLVPRSRRLYYEEDLGDAGDRLFAKTWAGVRAYYAARVKPTVDADLGFEGDFLSKASQAKESAPAAPNGTIEEVVPEPEH